MSTHITNCIICGQEVGCCQEEHALGIGGKHGEGGCENPPFIEFCSAECFLELKRRIDNELLRRRDEFPQLEKFMAEHPEAAIQ